VVVNDCARRVELRLFRHDTVTAATDPIETAAAGRRRDIQANQATGGWRLRVRSDATEGEWSYSVILDGVVVDPKIDIEC